MCSWDDVSGIWCDMVLCIFGISRRSEFGFFLLPVKNLGGRSPSQFYNIHCLSSTSLPWLRRSSLPLNLEMILDATEIMRSSHCMVKSVFKFPFLGWFGVWQGSHKRQHPHGDRDEATRKGRFVRLMAYVSRAQILRASTLKRRCLHSSQLRIQYQLHLRKLTTIILAS